jgi:transposase
MTISEYKLTELDIKLLIQQRDNQNNQRIRERFIAILMLSQNIEIEKIAMLLGKTTKTIENWYKLYQNKGINGLNSFNYKPKQPKLNFNEINQVIIWVIANNPGKVIQVKEYIKNKFKVDYTEDAIRKILRKRNLAWIKPKVVPGKPPTEELQMETVNKYFEMKVSCVPGTVFLFGDGMHLIHQTVLAYCWCDPSCPLVLETNTGRKRLNILGCYNPEIYEFIHLTGEENCNSERVIEFFENILKRYHKAPAIKLILDNAKYFKAAIVRDWLKEHPKFTLEFLPSYSPNLNLIERLWRFIKEELVKNSYCPLYKTFRAKAFRLLNNLDKRVDDFKSLMVEKFQIIKNRAVNYF